MYLVNVFNSYLSYFMVYNLSNLIFCLKCKKNCKLSHGIMVSILAFRTVDRWFDLLSSQTNDHEIEICCFFAKCAAFRNKNKDWFHSKSG